MDWGPFALIFMPLYSALDSRMQFASGVYFDPTTGITSVILTNTELIGPNKVKEIDDLPLIVVNIPPVLNETGHEAIVKEVKSLESTVIINFKRQISKRGRDTWLRSVFYGLCRFSKCHILEVSYKNC